MKVRNVWKIVIPLAIILLGILSMQVLTSFKSEPSRRELKPQSKIVEAQVVKLGSVPSTVTSYGRMTTTQPVALISEVAGELQSGSVPFQPGQFFRKGDLLVKVDDRQAQLDINSTKSDLLNALAQVLPEIKVDFPEKFPIWQAYFNDVSFDKKLSPLPEVSNQKVKLFLSRFNVYKLFFAVRNLEIRLEKHYFYAPFSGSIATADLRIGPRLAAALALAKLSIWMILKWKSPWLLKIFAGLTETSWSHLARLKWQVNGTAKLSESDTPSIRKPRQFQCLFPLTKPKAT